MKDVLLMNDTSCYGGGRAASVQSLEYHVLKDCNIVARHYAGKKRVPSGGLSEANAVIVNGGGVMRSDNHNAEFLLSTLERSQKVGKFTGLVNAAWTNMSATKRVRDILDKLDVFEVRDLVSLNEVRKSFGIMPEIRLDSCADFMLFTDGEVRADLTDQVVVWKIYPGTALRADDPQIRRWGRIDIEEWGWADTIATLRNAKLLLTGDIYGVYAATLAHIPFVVVEETESDMCGLFSWFQGDFPSVKHRDYLFEAIEYALTNRNLYEKFHHWMMTEAPIFEGLSCAAAVGE